MPGWHVYTADLSAELTGSKAIATDRIQVSLEIFMARHLQTIGFPNDFVESLLMWVNGANKADEAATSACWLYFHLLCPFWQALLCGGSSN